MGLLIDELTLVVPGNIVKKMGPDGKSSHLRVTRDQLADIKAAVAEAEAVFNGSAPTPTEHLTSDSSKGPPA